MLKEIKILNFVKPFFSSIIVERMVLNSPVGRKAEKGIR